MKKLSFKKTIITSHLDNMKGGSDPTAVVTDVLISVLVAIACVGMSAAHKCASKGTNCC